MGMSFKVAPGVRIRASSRGVSAGVGPRAARVHVGTRGVGVSSGIGPVSAYSRLGGGGHPKASRARPRSAGPTRAAVAAAARDLRAAERDADIEQIKALERRLVSVHAETFPPAEQIILPPPEPVDPEPIRAELEAAEGIPALIEEVGDGDAAPVAPEPEPVDRYELMRELRKSARAAIPFWRIRDQLEAARSADHEAEELAVVEVARRAEGREEEQARLDGVWNELAEARAVVARKLPERVAAEVGRRAEERAAEQMALDDDWRHLQANDPTVTLGILEQAFEDNAAPAAAIDCEGGLTTVVMQFVGPESIIPERKPAHTPTGKRTLKKRTKTEINQLYLAAMGSNVLATIKETFAVAPGTDAVQLLVFRRETSGKLTGELTALYAGRFGRADFAGASGSRDPARALSRADDALLNLKGQAETVSPLDLTERPDLAAVLDQLDAGLSG
jgi:hypothetical protein